MTCVVSKDRCATRHRPGSELPSTCEPFVRILCAAVIGYHVLGGPVALALHVVALAFLNGDVDLDRLDLCRSVRLEFLHCRQRIGARLANRGLRKAPQRISDIASCLVEVRDPGGEFFRLEVFRLGRFLHGRVRGDIVARLGGIFAFGNVAENFRGDRQIIYQTAHFDFD